MQRIFECITLVIPFVFVFPFNIPIKRFHNPTGLVPQDSGCLLFSFLLHNERLKFLCENFQFSIFYLLDFHKANKKQSSSLNLLPLWKAINRKHWKNTWSEKKKKRTVGGKGIAMNSCS